MNTETAPEITPARPRRLRRWLKRLGWCFIWLITLVVLATLVENRLGARAWRQAVDRTRAAGEPTELAQIIPPPAADAENFAAIPLFAPLFDYEMPAGGPIATRGPIWHDPEGKARLEALKLPPAKDPGSFRRGQFVDLAVWQRALEVEDQPGTPAAAVLGALRKFDPELDALREAAKRPRSRFPIRYQDHVAAALPHISVVMNFSRIISLRAVAGLAEGNAEAAQADLLLGLALEESLREEPLLISPLVRIAALEMLMQPLWEGLARRSWSDAQLASFDAALQRPDLVVTFQNALRGERLSCTQALDTIKHDPSLLQAMTGMNDGSVRPRPWSVQLASRVVPGGWIDFNKAAISDAHADIIQAANPRTHQFFPQRLTGMEEAFVREKSAESFNPRRALANMLFPAFTTSGMRFASTQATIDLARAGLALERHRLAHQAWPESLAALPPLPADVIGGAPLHYRLEKDGAYTLYSIGWNGRDDDGTTAWKGSSAPTVNWKEGDWVWPAYPSQKVEE